MHELLQSVPPGLYQATTDPCLRWRLLDIHGHVWVSLLWDQCSFLLGPGVHKVCAHQEFVSQSCVRCMVQLWQLYGGVNGDLLQEALSFFIPRSAAPRAPAPVGVHC